MTATDVNITAEVFPVDEIPKFERVGFTRTSVLEETLKAVAEQYGANVPVCIRQYAKKESAGGTLYNLRSRHGQPPKADGTERPAENGEPWDGWQFKIGPLDDGRTGLFATLT